MSAYRLIRPALFAADPELVHHWTLRLLEVAPWVPGLVGAWSAAQTVTHPALTVSAWGLTFANPVGLAAGFDKDGTALAGLAVLGCSFAEVGTVTPRPQGGNPRPRLFRLPQEEALINRMGFNNAGAEAVARHLARLGRRPLVVGVNVGKNRETPLERAADDYAACARVLADRADFFVINVSSPNTPGLRQLQAAEHLQELVVRVRAEVGGKPVLVKLAPDLADADLEAAVAAALAGGAAGFVATNTTVARDGLSHPRAAEAGGLSGRPLFARSTAVLRQVYRLTGGRVPLIGVGGIFSAEDAYAKIRAGATLVQVYTGLIYRGPGLVAAINRGLVRLLERDGFTHLQEAVGCDAEAT